MPIVDVAPLAAVVGLPADLVAPALILLAGYALCLPFSLLRVPPPQASSQDGNRARPTDSVAASSLARQRDRVIALRNAFSVVASGLLFVCFFDFLGYLQLLILSVTCYYITAATRTTKRGPVIVFVLSLGVLSANQLNFQIFSSTVQHARVDHTVPMMVMVQNVANFAWACYDGTRPDAELSSAQRAGAIRGFPSLLEFLGFIFFFPAFLLGPSNEFHTYKDFVSGTGVFRSLAEDDLNMLDAKRTDGDGATRPKKSFGYSRLFAAGKAFCVAIAMLLLNETFSPTYRFENCLLDDYATWPLWKRFWYLQPAAFIHRAQFYVGWKLAEGACILSGLAFTGIDPKTGKPQWKGCENVDIWHIEFAENPRMYLAAWNIHTALWLRNCVYLRLAPPPLPNQTEEERKKAQKNVSLATWATFVCSAFWHGFYPGYYLTFMSLSLATTCGRAARRLFHPLVHNAPSSIKPILVPLYNVLGTVATHIQFSYSAIPFQVKTLQNIWIIWSRNAFLGHVVMFGFLGLDAVGFWKIIGIAGAAKKAAKAATKGDEEVKIPEPRAAPSTSASASLPSAPAGSPGRKRTVKKVD
ncbi:MBOAT, membrane-bound O-acyltransferase family-domain-containing protein [Zopfochytrium polystomum]|nr:MBOAT, membrane-bound O-acyltransferase family-domain-containing protein [Zopfochytrium polystomum]